MTRPGFPFSRIRGRNFASAYRHLCAARISLCGESFFVFVFRPFRSALSSCGMRDTLSVAVTPRCTPSLAVSTPAESSSQFGAFRNNVPSLAPSYILSPSALFFNCRYIIVAFFLGRLVPLKIAFSLIFFRFSFRGVRSLHASWKRNCG